MSLHSINTMMEKPAGHGQLMGIGQVAHNELEQKLLATARTTRLPDFADNMLPSGRNTARDIDMISEIQPVEPQPMEKHDQFAQFEQMFGQIEEKSTVKKAVQKPEEPKELVQCFRCLGTTLNKRGRPCKKCRGTGMIDFPLMQVMQQAIAEEVSKYCQTKCKELYTSHLLKKKQTQKKVTHNVKCNVCDMFPIVGIRYKCSTRMDFNLCEACEAHQPSDAFPMIKIRNSDKAPVHLICQYNYAPGEKVEKPFEPKEEVEMQIPKNPVSVPEKVEEPEQINEAMEAAEKLDKLAFSQNMMDKLEDNELDTSIEVHKPDLKEEEPVEQPAEQKKNLLEQSFNANMQSMLHQSDFGRINYMERVNAGGYDLTYKANLINLMNMGFFDFDKNLKTLQNVFGSIDMAMEELLR